MQYELVRSNRRTLDAYGGNKKIYRRKAQLD